MSRAREIADRDLAGNELILDADNDTSITADSDDTINFKVGGSDRLTINSSGNIDIETGDIFFSTADKGICLGATSATAANTLHDYEEGSWTPSLDGGGSLGINNATYTKIGKMVYVGGYIHSIGNSTAVPNNSTVFGIGGLPFTVISGTSYHAAGAVSYTHSFDWDALGVDGITTTNAGTSIYFNRIDGSNATVKNSDVQSLDQMIFGLVYLTSD